MSYAITINNNNSYLAVNIAGTMESLVELHLFTQELNDISKQYSCTKFLIDATRMKYVMSVFDIVIWGDSLVTLGFPRLGYKFASVRSRSSINQGRVIETILSNRSITYRAFTDSFIAADWLCTNIPIRSAAYQSQTDIHSDLPPRVDQALIDRTLSKTYALAKLYP